VSKELKACRECGSADVRPAKLKKYKGLCKICKKKVWFSENRDKRLVYSKIYRENNPEKVSKEKKKSRNKKIEQYKARSNKYYNDNKSLLGKKNNERYHKNSEKILKKQRERGLKTRSRDTVHPKSKNWDAEKRREYNQKNSEKIKARRQVNLEIKWGSVIRPERCPKCKEETMARKMYVQINNDLDFVGFLCSFCNGEKNIRKRME